MKMTRNMESLAYFGFAMWLTALSCGTTNQTTGDAKPPATPTQSASQDLAGSGWNAVELSGTAVTTGSMLPDRQPHLVFGTDGRVSGADGCNRLTGPYSVKGDAITFGEMAGTRMACFGTEEIEQRFLAALKGTAHWLMTNGRLEFYDATGKPLAVFEPRKAE